MREYTTTKTSTQTPIKKPANQIDRASEKMQIISREMNPATHTTMTSKPTILALDLGTKMGWAMQSLSRVSGTVDFKNSRFEGGGMRYLKFNRWLDDMLHLAGSIDAIYFEEVRRHLGVDAAHAYGGFLAHLTAWCEYHQIAYEGVPVGTIKRHATGKGNANKAAMILAVKNLGYDSFDDNEADALALLNWALDNRTSGGVS